MRLQELLTGASPDHPAGEPRYAGRGFEVVNVGLAGVNAAFSSNRLEMMSKAYNPDLTIYGFTLNDIEGPHYRKLPREDRKALRQPTWRRALRFNESPSYLLRELWPRWIMVLEWDVFHPSEAERIGPMATELQHNYFENPEAWADFESALDLQAKIAGGRGICGHVLLHTHLTELVPEHRYLPIYEQVANAARARGLTVSESFPSFVNKDGEALWVNSFDVHPNADGHELLARALFEGLRALPPECWRSFEERRPGPPTPRGSRSSGGAR
jgi:lysophospholipase L1-like esterase